MSLDVGIRHDLHSYSFIQNEPTLSLEDDGYYWFLYPLFVELSKETGQLIDLYDGAHFQAETLDALERTLSMAMTLVESQPASWRVQVALSGVASGARYSIAGSYGLYEQVEKSQFINLLAQFQRILARARELGLPVVCHGD